MNTTQKIAIARKYVALHKAWPEYLSEIGKNKDSDYVDIFDNLTGGLYSNIEDNGGEFETEIPGYISNTGNPILFSWKKTVAAQQKIKDIK